MEKSGSGGTWAGTGDGDGACGCATASRRSGRGGDGAAGVGVGDAACCGADKAAGADFDERSKASEPSGFDSGSVFLGSGTTSSGLTISTVIGSAVTEPNGCTSAN